MTQTHRTDCFAPLDPKCLEGAQQALAARILSFSLNALGGPFNVMLRSPEPAGHILALGDYLRHRSAVEDRLAELAVLVHARCSFDNYEWALHYPRALKNGIDPTIAEDIRQGTIPEFERSDERTIFHFCSDICRQRRVSDERFHAAKDLLGELGITDLILMLGQYAMLSVIIAAAEIRPPNNRVPLLEWCQSPFAASPPLAEGQ